VLTHLSLFTGIGGLDLAAEWAGFTTVGQCEYADYPTKVLEKHWPDVPRWKDVRELTAESIWKRTGLTEITCISGGFPCQPHSLAGKRKASADERDLWPEYRRIISEVRPKWVVAENVPGLLSSESGRFFRGILRDFAEMGFDVGWCTYPASWVGAIHRRERIFTIAHTISIRWGIMDESVKNRYAGFNIQARTEWPYEKNSPLPYVSNVLHKPISGILRNDDGIANGMDRLKCLGNMVVPQQAYPIFKAIAEIETGGRNEND
jgi:DNA (cytosine-5)-methyltransferase 1